MAVDLFMNLDGIKGESADAKHKEEIDVLSGLGVPRSRAPLTWARERGRQGQRFKISPSPSTSTSRRPRCFSLREAASHIKSRRSWLARPATSPRVLTIKLENVLFLRSASAAQGARPVHRERDPELRDRSLRVQAPVGTGAGEAANTKGWTSRRTSRSESPYCTDAAARPLCRAFGIRLPSPG